MTDQADRREKFALTKTHTLEQIHLSWRPRTLSITNTSKFAVYVNIGHSDIPGASNFDEVIAPYSSYTADPAGAQDFCIRVDNSQDTGSDFNFPIKIILSTGAASVQAPLSPSLVAPTSTAYISKLLGVQSAALIDIWSTFDQPPSGTIIDSVSQARNGQYAVIPSLQGDTFADNSNKVAVFDGTTQYGNVLTNSLKNVFNPSEGTVLCWVKLPTAKWNDGNNYYAFQFQVDVNNRILGNKSPGGGWFFTYDTQNQSFVITPANAWFAFVFSWKANSGILRGRLYSNGVKQGADMVLSTTFAGILTIASLGALNNSPLWPGSLFCALWTVELAQADVSLISVAP